MKKILLSSLIAVMAVSAANAKIASTDYADYTADAAKTAAISAAATDAENKANAALDSAKAYADQAEADAIATAGTNATTAISDALKDYSTTSTIASTYAPISTTYTKDDVDRLVNVKANSADVYTKTDIDAKLGAEGTTTKAIEAAAQAAQAAQTTADGAVTTNTQQATAITNLQNADIAINDKFGELNGKTVAQAIADAQSAAEQDDLAMANSLHTLITENTTKIGKINDSAVMKSGIDSTKVDQIATNTTNIGTNTTAIETLNGTGDGSVSKAVADGIAGIATTVADGNGAIATLTQANGQVSVTRKLVATTDLNESVNSALTNANNAANFMQSVQSASTAEADANKAYVLTASKGTDGAMTYTWEEIDRSVLN